MVIARVLESVLRRAGLHARLQEMWRKDIARSAAAADPIDKAISQLKRQTDDGKEWQRINEARLNECEARIAQSEARIAQSDVALQDLRKRLAELERIAVLDNRQARLAADWQVRFRPADIRAHVARAVSEAPIHGAPGAHLLVEQLFPPDFYEFLLASLPSPDLFGHDDPPDMHLGPGPFDHVPRLTRLLWEFVGTDVADALTGAALQRLRAPILSRYEALFGRERAETVLAIPHGHSGERLTLRRCGYREQPHVDPKRAAVTVIVSLAQGNVSETARTTLYSIEGDFTPMRTGISYPKAHGVTCTPVSHVPFNPNSALILVNTGVAHAMEIPDQAGPADLVRYGCQFYIGPNVQSLIDVASTLAPADQQPWLGLVGERDL